MYGFCGHEEDWKRRPATIARSDDESKGRAAASLPNAPTPTIMDVWNKGLPLRNSAALPSEGQDGHQVQLPRMWA